MSRWILVSVGLLLMALLLGACGGTAPASPTATLAPGLPTATPPPTATTIAPPTAATAEGGFEGGTLPAGRNDLFSASGACTVCHTRMTDEAGKDVSIDSHWRASIKAQAARDPYYLASVRAEVEALPDQRAAIENSCATCHMPMADYTEAAAGGAGAILDDGFLDPDHPLHELALDGVSCTLCHQIRSGNLGASANSGGYVIDTQAKPGEREIFGPFAVDEIQAQIMQGASGFIPVQSTHVAQSELCATCHTLYTPVFDAAGKVVGEFPEQVPYLEWFYSDYRQGPTCQGCHMPEAQGGVKVSVTSPNLRSPFAQHTFWGGNAYMLGMLQAFGEELELTASAAQLEAARQGTLAQLQSATATIAIENLVSGGVDHQRRRAPREPGRAQAPDSLPLPAGVAAHHCRRRCRERGLRVGRRGGGWRHPGQRQRCRPNGLRAALPDDQPAGPGADLRGDPRNA